MNFDQKITPLLPDAQLGFQQWPTQDLATDPSKTWTKAELEQLIDARITEYLAKNAPGTPLPSSAAPTPQPLSDWGFPADGSWEEWGSYRSPDISGEPSSGASGLHTKPEPQWIPGGRSRITPDGSYQLEFYHREDPK